MKTQLTVAFCSEVPDAAMTTRSRGARRMFFTAGSGDTSSSLRLCAASPSPCFPLLLPLNCLSPKDRETASLQATYEVHGQSHVLVGKSASARHKTSKTCGDDASITYRKQRRGHSYSFECIETSDHYASCNGRIALSSEIGGPALDYLTSPCCILKQPLNTTSPPAASILRFSRATSGL